MSQLETPIETDRLLSFKETANRLSVSVRTLERRIDAGQLAKPEFIGPKRVYRESMINTLIEQITSPSR